jgi:hypothetical protein
MLKRNRDRSKKMMNSIHKFIYNLSLVAPLLLVFSIVWLIKQKDAIVAISCLGAGAFILILFILSFTYGKKNLAPITIRTSDISPNDQWIVAYIVSYVIPLTNIVLEDFNLIICGVIALMILLLLPFFNIRSPNLFLFLRGYHFYQISAENGISGYTLISKRKIRKKQDIKVVDRMFEFLLLDSEE